MSSLQETVIGQWIVRLPTDKDALRRALDVGEMYHLRKLQGKAYYAQMLRAYEQLPPMPQDPLDLRHLNLSALHTSRLTRGLLSLTLHSHLVFKSITGTCPHGYGIDPHYDDVRGEHSPSDILGRLESATHLSSSRCYYCTPVDVAQKLAFYEENLASHFLEPESGDQPSSL
jgi:hypothetical protein